MLLRLNAMHLYTGTGLYQRNRNPPKMLEAERAFRAMD